MGDDGGLDHRLPRPISLCACELDQFNEATLAGCVWARHPGAEGVRRVNIPRRGFRERLAASRNKEVHDLPCR